MTRWWPFSRRKGFTQPPFWSLDQGLLFPSSSGERERIDNSFNEYIAQVYKRDGVVWACVLARMLLFSEARFQWRRFSKGRPTDLFGDESLKVLEEPWPGGTTGELLAHMEQDVSLAGNSYWTKVSDEHGERLRRLRPDWVTIITGSKSGSPHAIDARVVAYAYEPTGVVEKPDPVLLLPNQVAHYSPYPDPAAQWRGMSWITPVIREIQSDMAATDHKLNFFKRGATFNIAVRLDKDINSDEFQAFKDKFKADHEGALNAYKTLFLGGGADVTPVSANMQQMDFKRVQGGGETRIAAAANVPPIVVGLSEGLDASTYSNYGQARRKFADHYARPHWRMASASLQTLMARPKNAGLWYDARDIAFLREDAKEEMEVLKQRMLALEAGIRAGFTPESVVRAIESGDLTGLEHTGLFSVQLQPPTSAQASAADPAPEPTRSDDEDEAA